jgi:2-phospho-L-lactate guanylyltransferase
MTTFGLIPVKELDKAKARLSAVLDDAARRELVLAMLRDVLAAATACSALDGVVVVTRDETVSLTAREAGAEGLAEPGGLNEALTSAAEKLRARGATRLLVLAADLPLADAASMAAILEAGADVIVVPSRDAGTNALVCTAGAIDFQFGPDSARKHLAAAEAAGLRALSLDLPRLALDIDTPGDLDRLRAAGEAVGRHTGAALERSGLPASTRKAQ